VVVVLLDARRTEDGGFSAIPGGESSMLHTLAAVQLAALTGGIGALCVDERLLAYACAQLAEATASGCDVRATCCAILTLALLGAAPPRSSEQAVRAREALLLCRNWDGAFGGAPLAESHAGTTFCAVAALTAMGELDALSDADRTARWLADRQQPCGGFNGRPDKEPDLCYAWWCVASLALLGRTHWIDARAALRFVERCASVDGGLAFAPAQLSDPYHTFFGLAARRVLDESQALLDESQAPGASPSIEWAYALPTAVVPQACRLGPSADA
jgi:geranylgeranyl transferase type-2 subunit beta